MLSSPGIKHFRQNTSLPVTPAFYLSHKEQPLSHSLCFLSFFLLVLCLLAISALCGLIREQSKVLRLQNVQIRGLLILFLNGCSHPVQSVIELLSPAWKLSQTRDLYLSSCLLCRGGRVRGDRRAVGEEGSELWASEILKVGLYSALAVFASCALAGFDAPGAIKQGFGVLILGFFECCLPVLTKKPFCQRKQLLPSVCVCMCVYMLGDSVQVLCLPCAYTLLPMFPTVSSVLSFPVYAQVSRAAALLKAQGSPLRAGGWCLAVLREAGRILICGG